MPLSQRHQTQKSKNYLLLIVLLGIGALLFALTALKISGVL
jgi:hypothetical protein